MQPKNRKPTFYLCLRIPERKIRASSKGMLPGIPAAKDIGKPVVKFYSAVPMNALKDRKSFVKAIRRAKRAASGKRAAAACAACKRGRTRCDDTRPCKRCRSLNLMEACEITELAGVTKDQAHAVCVREVETFHEMAESQRFLTPYSPIPKRSTHNIFSRIRNQYAHLTKSDFPHPILWLIRSTGDRRPLGSIKASTGHSSPILQSYERSNRLSVFWPSKLVSPSPHQIGPTLWQHTMKHITCQAS
jgi:hypothetical protein